MDKTAHVEYLLRLADNAMVLSQRLSEWCGHGPVLEEDIALTNMALDLLGQARALLTHAAGVEGQGFDEDQLAFLRDERQFFNLTLAELPMRRSSAHSPGGDFADTVLRNFLLACWLRLLWQRLAASSDSELAAIAGKAVKEARYHQLHAGDWVVRLGDGTDESAARMRAALARAWPYTAEMFAHDAIDDAAVASGLGPARSELQAEWRRDVDAVLAEAGLAAPAATPFISTGTLGRHSEHLGFILAEMQVLQRSFPGGRW
jgi:ring-1,2-phenylacetyl-CoA epoxidase subunit PaaC